MSLISLAVWLSVSAACAQQDSPVARPYAAINREAINYAGPGRETASDLAGAEIKIGILAPLQGPRQREGAALLAAAQMAVEDESATPLPNGRRLALVARDETGLWGRASSEIVRLVFDDRAVALITLTDGAAAHLAEQVGNRVGVPVITLSSDSTTTEINIPWLFRIVPNDAVQARAFAEAIYGRQSFQKVLLVTERDHDGRVGGEEFEKAARALQAPPPARLEVALPLADVSPLWKEIQAQSPEAIVLWTSAAAAAALLEGIQTSNAAIYVCGKALQEPFISVVRGQQNIWVAGSRVESTGSKTGNFSDRYRARTGRAPSPASEEVYDAVRLVAAALRQSGPNRARLRDSLAKVSDYRGASGIVSFDGAGNNQAGVALVSLR